MIDKSEREECIERERERERERGREGNAWRKGGPERVAEQRTE